jgi:hypothetical protein
MLTLPGDLSDSIFIILWKFRQHGFIYLCPVAEL